MGEETVDNWVAFIGHGSLFVQLQLLSQLFSCTWNGGLNTLLTNSEDLSLWYPPQLHNSLSPFPCSLYYKLFNFVVVLIIVRNPQNYWISSVIVGILNWFDGYGKTKIRPSLENAHNLNFWWKSISFLPLIFPFFSFSLSLSLSLLLCLPWTSWPLDYLPCLDTTL